MNIDIGDVREMLECGTATNMELTEAVEFLLRERRALGREIVRLKIAHLRRMAKASADRVLGDGMVAVDRNALLSLFYVDDNGGPRFPTPREQSLLGSLRANQGGAAT